MKKGDLVQDPAFVQSDYWQHPERTTPMVSVANKKELKDVMDIMNEKIRLFFISEFHHCHGQLKYGKKSSLRMKNLKWSAYGFSPFLSGVHDLAQKLLSKPIRLWYDVSGWDKFIGLMEDLYKIIREKTNIPPSMRDHFEWVIRHTIEFICVLWDGDVILKKYGNCSGSGVTTRDNTLMHVIIAAAFLCEAYFIKNGEMPTWNNLASQVVKLFGDDSVFAVDEEYSHVLYRQDEEDGFLHLFFKRMGMKLKFLHGGRDYPVEKMEFLGFRFCKIGGRYYPYYDPIRLAHSFINTNDKADSLDAYISKCFVLTMMSYATEHRDTFLGAYKAILDSVKPHEITPGIQGFLNIGPLTSSILESFYSGSESDSVDFPFFESTWRLEEEKDSIFFQDEHSNC
jgi:hypothetical protein